MKKEQLTVKKTYQILGLSSIILILLTGCGKDKSSFTTYENLFYPNYALIYGPYFAFEVENNGKVEKVVIESEFLKNHLIENGGFNDENYKINVLYSIKKKVPLTINDTLFHLFKEEGLFVKPITYIDSLFENTPMKIILDSVISPKRYKDFEYLLILDKELSTSDHYKYLIYKLFQKELFVNTHDESGYFYIIPESKGLIELK